MFNFSFYYIIPSLIFNFLLLKINLSKIFFNKKNFLINFFQNSNHKIFFRDLHNFIIQKYVEKRKEETGSFKEGHQYITPRTLLAIIRVAQGLARLRFNEEVEQMDIDEALRLIEASRSSINEDDTAEKNTYNARTDSMSSIFLIIRDMCSSQSDKTVGMQEIERKVLSKGFKIDALNDTIENYANLSIIYVNSSKTEVTLI